jgi:two-component system NtrC family sensor kinase
MVSAAAILADQSCLSGGCHSGHVTGDVLGVLRFTQSAEVVQRAQKSSRAAFILFSILAALISSLLVGILISARLHTPMKRLMEGTGRIAAGDLHHRLPIDRADELGQLAAGVNEMSRKLAQSQARLLHSERLGSMGLLAAGVAHELNNPMTGILAYTESLIEETDPDDPRIADLRVIEKETLRCRGIVRDLLDFVRQDTPLMVLESLDSVVALALRLVKRQASFRDVTIIHDPGPDIPPLEIDPAQIQQVILNLLINAADAMTGQGIIRISSRHRRAEHLIELAISDDGPGIPEDLVHRIFEPFFSTKDRRSNGLGLSISQSIVQRHGGRIEIETSSRSGTTFRLLFDASRRVMTLT